MNLEQEPLIEKISNLLKNLAPNDRLDYVTFSTTGAVMHFTVGEAPLAELLALSETLGWVERLEKNVNDIDGIIWMSTDAGLEGFGKVNKALLDEGFDLGDFPEGIAGGQVSKKTAQNAGTNVSPMPFSNREIAITAFTENPKHPADYLQRPETSASSAGDWKAPHERAEFTVREERAPWGRWVLGLIFLGLVIAGALWLASKVIVPRDLPAAQQTQPEPEEKVQKIGADDAAWVKALEKDTLEGYR